MRNSAEAKDYKATVYYADILLRADPAVGPYVVPILAQIGEDKDRRSLGQDGSRR